MSDSRDEKVRPALIELGRVRHLERPRADGYMPITDLLSVRGRTLGVPSDEAWRLFWSAARRLDGAHRQIERIREAIQALPPSGSPAGRQAMQEVVGDVEMAIWSLDKALDISVSIQGTYRIERGFPKVAAEKRPLVARLRDHWSHIDERALGKVRGAVDPSAEEAFGFGAIFSDREITDGNASLGIDDEATELCAAMRDYLVTAWNALTLAASAETASAKRPE